MRYKIKVIQINPEDEHGRCQDEYIYEQIVDDLDLQAVIAAANKRMVSKKGTKIYLDCAQDGNYLWESEVK